MASEIVGGGDEAQQWQARSSRGQETRDGVMGMREHKRQGGEKVSVESRRWG